MRRQRGLTILSFRTRRRPQSGTSEPSETRPPTAPVHVQPVPRLAISNLPARTRTPRGSAPHHRTMRRRRAVRPVCARRPMRSDPEPASRREPSTFPTNRRHALTAVPATPPAATRTPRGLADSLQATSPGCRLARSLCRRATQDGTLLENRSPRILRELRNLSALHRISRPAGMCSPQSGCMQEQSKPTCIHPAMPRSPARDRRAAKQDRGRSRPPRPQA